MKNKFRIGQVVKFKGNKDQWVYEKVFAIGKCDVNHVGLNYVRVTNHGVVPNNIDIGNGVVDCGCLGDIKSGPLALNSKEKGA